MKHNPVAKTYSIFLKTVLATVLFISTYYILLPVLPLYIQALGVNKFQIGLIMGIFSISSLILRPISGQLVDVHGRKKVMLLSILIYLVTPFLYFLGANLVVLCLIQVIYGFAMGSYTTSATTYISDIAPRESLATILGWFSIALITAKGIAPALGTYLFKTTNFIFIIWLSWALALLALFIVSRLKELRKEEAIKETSTLPYLQIIKSPVILLPTVTLFSGLISFGVISVMLPLFAQSRGIENIEVFFVINTVTVIATRLLTGWIKQKKLPHLVITAMGLLIVSLILMSFVTTFQHLILVGLIYGLGYGILYPALSALVVLYVPFNQKGAALGFFTAAFDLGVSGGTILGGLSEYIDFVYVYRLAALIPLAGLGVFVMKYMPLLKQDVREEGV